jgi:ATP-dependent RNA helicase RhlE
LFSATFSKDIKKLAMGILHQPFMWKQLRKTQPWMLLSKVYPVKEKTELIIKLITEGNWKQILVSPRKQGANKLTESMISAGIKAAIHGNKDKAPVPKRGLQRRNPTALVATDIAAQVWTSVITACCQF